MNINSVPKWQRELRGFLGIKSGIILDGNVHDEYPMFSYGPDGVELEDTDTLDQTLLSLVDRGETQVFFFDPINGFYCDGGTVEQQRETLKPLLEGYDTRETVTAHGTKVCLMPVSKGGRVIGATPPQSFIWVSEIIRRAMIEGIGGENGRNLVFVLNFASRLDACNLNAADANTMFLNLMAATTEGQASQRLCNTLVLVVDKYNDIPAWLYLNNPNVRTISVCVPDRAARRLYLETLFGNLAPFQLLGRPDFAPGKQFVAETEGMQLQELRQILMLARRMSLLPEDIQTAFRLYKYGVSDNPWENLENDILAHIESRLEDRVKGQDEALAKVKAVVTRAVKGLSGLQHSGPSHKPKGIMFFAGPTGVGKTETAKALAESIFGDENACIRFDMSEYRLDASDQKLFGAPPGYVGYEGGGQLTNAVRNRPFSVLLFDEIEKASPTILDKFLQILEDGRMTDNQGNTVYFGETIIIFTSNIGLMRDDPNEFALPGEKRHKIPTIMIEDPQKDDTPEFRQKVTETLTNGVKDYFNDIGRPELLNRLGDNNIIVFQFIDKKDAEEICRDKLRKICAAIRDSKGISIQTDEVVDLLTAKAVMERANGGRGVGNMLEREFQNPLAGFLCSVPGIPSALRCRAGADGKVSFEVIADGN